MGHQAVRHEDPRIALGQAAGVFGIVEPDEIVLDRKAMGLDRPAGHQNRNEAAGLDQEIGSVLRVEAWPVPDRGRRVHLAPGPVGEAHRRAGIARLVARSLLEMRQRGDQLFHRIGMRIGVVVADPDQVEPVAMGGLHAGVEAAGPADVLGQAQMHQIVALHRLEQPAGGVGRGVVDHIDPVRPSGLGIEALDHLHQLLGAIEGDDHRGEGRGSHCAASVAMSR